MSRKTTSPHHLVPKTDNLQKPHSRTSPSQRQTHRSSRHTSHSPPSYQGSPATQNPIPYNHRQHYPSPPPYHCTMQGHTQTVTEFICLDCANQLICGLCIGQVHSGHKVIHLRQYANTLKTLVKEGLLAIDQEDIKMKLQRHRYQEHLTTLEQLAASQVDFYSRVKQKVVGALDRQIHAEYQESKLMKKYVKLEYEKILEKEDTMITLKQDLAICNHEIQQNPQIDPFTVYEMAPKLVQLQEMKRNREVVEDANKRCVTQIQDMRVKLDEKQAVILHHLEVFTKYLSGITVSSNEEYKGGDYVTSEATDSPIIIKEDPKTPKIDHPSNDKGSADPNKTPNQKVSPIDIESPSNTEPKSASPPMKNSAYATASSENTITLWDKNFSFLQTLQGHSDYVLCLCHMKMKRLASGSADNSIKIWNLGRQECEKTLTGHIDSVWSLCRLMSGQLASGSGSLDKSIKIWDPTTGGCVATLQGHTYCVKSLLSHSSGYLLSSSDDCTIRVWDVDAHTSIWTINAHSNSVMRIIELRQMEENGEGGEFSKLVATCSYDGGIKVWDFRSEFAAIEGKINKLIENTNTDKLCVNQVKEFYPFSSLIQTRQGLLLAGTNLGNLILWDYTKGEILKTISTSLREINTIIEISEGLIATCSHWDNTINVIDIANEKLISSFKK